MKNKFIKRIEKRGVILFSFFVTYCILKSSRKNPERSLALKTKKIEFINRFVPLWAFPPLLTILAVNCLIYWGSSWLTANRYHYDFTMAFDRAVPLLPVFVWIYILAFPFWAVGYMLVAKRGREQFYRFVATDLTIHLICFLIFVLIPTTNIRPEISGNTLSEKVLLLVYSLDGGSNPSNLFPSIHCYVSWMSWRGTAGSKEIPVWYQRFSLVFAVLIIISTQVLKQHYIVDAIAALLLVEFFWRFYQKGNRYRFIEKIFNRTK